MGLPKADQIAATGPACSADRQRAYVPLAEIPPLLRKAAILDREPDFYERLSLSPVFTIVFFLARALVSDPKPPFGSITEPVSRCLMDSLAPDLCRGNCHLTRIMMADRVAKTLSRDRILEIYLNESYLGRGAYGVGAASMAYFGKPLGSLSIDESALLVVLYRASDYLDRHRDRARRWRNHVIDRMLQAGLISEADAASARERPLELREKPATKSPDL
jgi:penicillin-binding protein 1A